MNMYINTISYSNVFPTFLKPHQDKISKYFSSNHFIDDQDNDLIKYDVVDYIIQNYVINTSNDIIKDDVREILYDLINIDTIYGYVPSKYLKKKK